MPTKRIGEILVEEGYLQASDLNKALELQKSQGGLLGCHLVRLGLISEEDLIIALSRQLDVPYIQLKSYRVNREAVKLIPKDVCEKFLIFPFDKGEKEISVAMSNPLDEESLEAVKKRVRSKVQIFLARMTEIRDSINHYFPVSAPARREEDGGL